MKWKQFPLFLTLTVALLLSGARPALSALGDTERVSVDTLATDADGLSTSAAVSDDGRYVAFASGATDLVPGDTNGAWDIFVRDRQTGQTERVSIDSFGAEADLSSSDPAISGDGRTVAFRSDATNLVPGDTNGWGDIFVHDRQTGTTERVNVDGLGNQAIGQSQDPAISDDGQIVAFGSSASNLVPDDTGVAWDVFVHDRLTGVTSRVSLDSLGTETNQSSFYPSISGDGRYVAFYSMADNIVSGDTNADWDVFVYDRTTGTTDRVSVDSFGAEGNDASYDPSISDDGQTVAFWSYATNLVAGDVNGYEDIFVHDRQSGLTTRESVDPTGLVGGTGYSRYPSLSADGRYVAFESGAGNLIAHDTNYRRDVFVRDRQTGLTRRVSINSFGAQSAGDSFLPALSSNGLYTAFESWSTDLVPDDTNGWTDVFLHTGLAPLPDIDINGEDGPLYLVHGSLATVTVALDVGDYAGTPADWWVQANSGFGTYWFTLSGWVPSANPVVAHQGPIFNLAPYTILSMSNLPIGSYTAHFVLDDVMDGVMSTTWADSVSFTVTAAQ